MDKTTIRPSESAVRLPGEVAAAGEAAVAAVQRQTREEVAVGGCDGFWMRRRWPWEAEVAASGCSGRWRWRRALEAAPTAAVGSGVLIASYAIPYMGVAAAVGANPSVNGYLLAGLLAVEAGQDAVIRALLYERKNELVPPYNITVAEFTIKISELRNRLAMCGVKDEGLIVPMPLGAEGKLTTNILSADKDSLAYSRTPAEVLRILYGTGNESMPGGFLPQGGNGKIAREFLEPR
ncbi:hypothetical protein ZIOFF_004549 [Zingiber officinale]|uniref:Desiccation-related protein PCC13-62 n=1 Tax=Zingiber officinale TaxID=94328 RepID=A0A8J5I928_ZINOF|nr:hypothetical protein ZIOFF_004549 [Zingiber officinale]